MKTEQEIRNEIERLEKSLESFKFQYERLNNPFCFNMEMKDRSHLILEYLNSMSSCVSKISALYFVLGEPYEINTEIAITINGKGKAESERKAKID